MTRRCVTLTLLYWLLVSLFYFFSPSHSLLPSSSHYRRSTVISCLKPGRHDTIESPGDPSPFIDFKTLSKISSELSRAWVASVFVVCALISSVPFEVSAGMLTFPLPAPMKNNIVLMRSGESYSDARGEIQTNPAKKLRQDNALTPNGREQVIEAARKLTENDFIPTYVWTSNTERAYETATILARTFQLGQNRIVPEFTFLDARAAGKYEGTSINNWEEIHSHDEKDGILYKPPPTTDGTPSDSVTDVLVRINQLVSTIESMYSGENVIIVAPDSEVLSVLEAAVSDDDPDKVLPFHAKYAFKNGEYRLFQPLVRPRELLDTGQTQSEADDVTRKMTAMRFMSESKNVKKSVRIDSWFDLWKQSIDNE